MAKGLLNSCALALVLAQAVWVLPGGVRPAAAQQVTLPTNFISPNVPQDVSAGSAASIQDLAIFAWQEFIALNWTASDPAVSGKRGLPNTDVGFTDIAPDNGSFPLVVWQTYRHKNELFPPDGTTDPTFDGFAPTYAYNTNPKMGTGVNGQIPSFTLFNNLDETSEIGLANMYAHANPTSNPASGIRVAYEAKVNRAVFSYLVGNGFTNSANGYGLLGNALSNTGVLLAANPNSIIQNVGRCTLPPGVSATSIIMLPCGGVPTTFDPTGEGAVEVKAAWRALDPTKGDIPSHFFTRNVIYYTGQPPNQKYNNAIYGLVALHIIHKTKSFPAFVFASWEQVENYDDVTPANSQNLAFDNTGDAASFPDIAVTRAHAINSPIPPVNAAVQTAFKAANASTVWQYYKLIGVQATPVDGPPPASATPDDLSYYFMANLMVETNQVLQNFTGSVSASLTNPPGQQKNVYVAGATGSPFQMGGCQGCHGFQGQSLGGDMSVLVANGPSNSEIAESIDASGATAVKTFTQRLHDVRLRSNLLLHHFFSNGHFYTTGKPPKHQ
jgi:hypothetical protein